MNRVGREQEPQTKGVRSMEDFKRVGVGVLMVLALLMFNIITRPFAPVQCASQTLIGEYTK